MNISLKTQNIPLQIAFSICFGAFFWWTARGRKSFFDISQLDSYYQSALMTALATIITLAISEIVPRHIKLVLVYWKFKHPAPGHRAFSEIGPSDHRVSMANLSAKYGNIPSEPSQQDKLFYKIYKPLRDNEGIKDAHKSFLLFRELTILSLIAFLLGVPSVYVISKDPLSAIIFAAVSSSGYIVCAFAARGAGKRLVANTLSAASV